VSRKDSATELFQAVNPFESPLTEMEDEELEPPEPVSPWVTLFWVGTLLLVSFFMLWIFAVITYAAMLGAVR